MSIWSRVASAAAALRTDSGNPNGEAFLQGLDGWGLNSAAGVRVSAETAMQHTMVIACVSVIFELLDKLPSAWCDGSTSGSVAAVKGGVKTDQRGAF